MVRAIAPRSPLFSILTLESDNLVAKNGTVYLAHPANEGSITRVRIGETPVTLATRVGFATAFALGEEFLYWSAEGQSCCSPPDGVLVGKMGLDGSGRAALAVSPNANQGAWDIALREPEVFWIERRGPDSGSIKRLPGDGPATIVVHENQEARAVALDEQSLYWLIPDDAVNEGGVFRMPLAGGASTKLAPAHSTWQGFLRLIAFEGSLIWLAPPSRVFRVSSDGGDATEASRFRQREHVWARRGWIGHLHHRDWSIREPTRGREDSARGRQARVSDSRRMRHACVALDENNIYWVNSSLEPCNGSLRVLPKPER